MIPYPLKGLIRVYEGLLRRIFEVYFRGNVKELSGLIFLMKALFSLLKPYFLYKAVAPDGIFVFFSIVG